MQGSSDSSQGPLVAGMRQRGRQFARRIAVIRLVLRMP